MASPKNLPILFFLLLVTGTAFSQQIDYVAGGPGDGRLATQADINPAHLSVGPDNTIYVSSNYGSMRKIDPGTGIVSKVFSAGTNTKRIYRNGKFYYAEHAEVYEIDANGVKTKLAGVGFGDSGDGGPATSAAFGSISDFTFDAAGNLFIVDNFYRKVRKVDATTKIISTVAGNGTTVYAGDGSQATASGFNAGWYIAVDANNNLYISEYLDGRILRVNLTTGVISIFAGGSGIGLSGDGGPALSARFKSPQHLLVRNNILYLSDVTNYRIRAIDIGTTTTSTIAGTTQGFSGDGASATAAKLDAVGPFTFDNSGNMLISANRRIRKITGTTITTIAGTGAYSPDGTLASASSLNQPWGIITNAAGDIFFAERANHVIRKIDHTTKLLSTIAGTGVKGNTGDGGAATSATLNMPTALVFDLDGNILFSDYENHRIRKINMTNGNISTFAGTGTMGSSGDGGLATAAQLFNPSGLAVNAAGDVFIADLNNKKIRKVNRSDSRISTIAGTGANGSTGDGGLATLATFNYPTFLTISPQGDLYISDNSNFKVRRIDHVTNIITTVVGSGNPGTFQEGIPATQLTAPSPQGLALTARGDLWFTRTNMILSVQKETGIVYRVAGDADSYGYSGDGGESKSAVLSSAMGLWPDANGNILFTDFEANTIRKITTTQSITFNAFSAHTFGEQPFAIESSQASASSGLPLTFTSSDPTIASNNGGTITILKAGTVDITATQPGSALFQAATPVVKQLVIGKATPAIEITSPDSGGQNGTITLQSEKGGSTGTVTYSLTNQTGTATLTNNILTLNTQGTVKVTASITATDNYLATSVDQVITIGKPFSTVTVPSSGNVGTSVDITAQVAGSAGAVTYEVENISGNASLQGTTLSLTAPGYVRLKITVPGDATYAETTVSKLFAINLQDGTSFAAGMKVFGTTGGGEFNSGLIFKASTTLDDFGVLKTFKSTDDGRNPYQTNLVLAPNGKLYGMNNGGASGNGNIFTIDPATNAYQVVVQLQANEGVAGGMFLASNGKFYGAMNYGGTNKTGALFEYDYTTNALSKKFEFNNESGYLPVGIPAESGGKLFLFTTMGGNANYGTIFSYTIATGATQAFSLSSDLGGRTYASPTIVNGKIYGSNERNLFEYDPATSTFVKRVTLDSSTGFLQYGAMTLAPNGKLYGTFYYGGGVFAGTIFEYVPGASSVTRQYDFAPTNPSGAAPACSLTLAANGKMYGVTSSGGSASGGVIFEYVPGTTTLAPKKELTNLTGLRTNSALAALPDGRLYGLTPEGGKYGAGTAFVYDPSNLSFTLVKEFADTEMGRHPSSIAYANNIIYGIAGGGTKAKGVVFEYNLGNDTYSKTVDLDPNLRTEVLTHPNGTVYLAATYGGQMGNGQLFKYNPATKETKLLYLSNDHPNDGTFPQSLVVAHNGKIYGVAGGGGTNSLGAIFEFDPYTETYTRKISFSNDLGYNVQSIVAEGSMIYGSAYFGANGNNSTGVVFTYDPEKDEYAKVISMGDAGANLILKSNVVIYDGVLYGVADDRPFFVNPTTFLFSVDLKTKTFKRLRNLPSAVVIYKGLTVSPHGKIWISLTGDNFGVKPTIQEYDPATKQVTPKIEFTGPNGNGVSGPLLVLKNDQTITFPEIGTKNSDAGSFEVNAVASSGLPVRYLSINPAVATVSGNTVTIVGKGQTQIVAVQSGSGIFNPAEARSLLTVKDKQTITFAAIPAKTLGAGTFTLGAKASSDLAVSYTATSGKVTIENSTVTLVSAGRATIVAKQAGNNEYAPAADVEQSFCINPAKPVITIQNGGSVLIASGVDNTQQWYLNGAEIAGATKKQFSPTQDGTYTVKEKVDDCSSELSGAANVVTNGVEDLEKQVTIYPNPVKHELIVDLGQLTESSIAISDLMGRVVESRNTSTGVQNFNVSSFARGAYIVRIKTQAGFVNKVFIKAE
ncbi:MAG TPA: choice-of-anchor tandem repeat GloVer-containing protein [Cyclobacteriaceae bacterium]|nr:choice-of-anchor tandem repeat GloVer-containing protein [Cyclobacteriaceae bacterium]